MSRHIYAVSAKSGTNPEAVSPSSGAWIGKALFVSKKAKKPANVHIANGIAVKNAKPLTFNLRAMHRKAHSRAAGSCAYHHKRRSIVGGKIG